ncbi:glycerate kinase [Carettochelys insculpta]|uniref:glycerate kinase n=1 Tax=Carettochelys insculpta TaxID=44489 RepID=UPI003EC06B31
MLAAKRQRGRDMTAALRALLTIHRATTIPACWGQASHPRSMSLWEDGLHLFRSAVGVVLPAPLLRRAMALKTDGSARLVVGDRAYPVRRNLYLVGFGKAVLGMAAAAEEILGHHLTQGVVSVPHGIQACLQQAGMEEMLLKPHSRIQVIEGAKHNLPDREALKAASLIRELAEGLMADDLLLVLISGGGSALLPAPTPPVLLDEKEKVTKLLASRGATIQELNTVRKALSLLKGGGLARAAYPAQVLSLILSDVIGNPVDVIASGPTVYSPRRAQGCLQILAKYSLLGTLPKSVETVLSASDPSAPEDDSHVCNVVIGSNSLALEEAKRQAEDLGYRTLILSAAVCGEVSRVAKFYSQLIQLVCLRVAGPDEAPRRDQVRGHLLKLAAELAIPDLALEDSLNALQGLGSEQLVCLLAGGETTVQVQGDGKGGRNQELALRVALELHQAKATGACFFLRKYEVLFLSGGTDGQDGPTEAAGAFCSPELVGKAAREGLDVETFLSDNDSYTFFSKFQSGHHHLLTGLTGTNVMDIQVVLVRARDR